MAHTSHKIPVGGGYAPLPFCQDAHIAPQAGTAGGRGDHGTGVITDITTGKTYQAEPFPEFIQNIIRCGGLLASLKEGK